MEILFNGKLSIEVSAHGAELCSICGKQTPHFGNVIHRCSFLS